jgi:orotidine-5'-phosphate decarboxylase
MMEAARERLAGLSEPPLLVAVTILTSLGQEDIAEIGYRGSPLDNVLRLTRLAEAAGLDGVVCSPLEAAEARKTIGARFALVTPGVRPAGADQGDQQRIMTPAKALRAGADYLVIGRPITASADPMTSLDAIQTEIGAVLD